MYPQSVIIFFFNFKYCILLIFIVYLWDGVGRAIDHVHMTSQNDAQTALGVKRKHCHMRHRQACSHCVFFCKPRPPGWPARARALKKAECPCALIAQTHARCATLDWRSLWRCDPCVTSIHKVYSCFCTLTDCYVLPSSAIVFVSYNSPP